MSSRETLEAPSEETHCSLSVHQSQLLTPITILVPLEVQLLGPFNRVHPIKRQVGGLGGKVPHIPRIKEKVSRAVERAQQAQAENAPRKQGLSPQQLRTEEPAFLSLGLSQQRRPAVAQHRGGRWSLSPGSGVGDGTTGPRARVEQVRAYGTGPTGWTQPHEWKV